jgi:hypothetical protein
MSNRTVCGSVMIELPWPDFKLVGHNKGKWWSKTDLVKKHRTWAASATLAADIPEPEGDGDIRVSATFYPPHRRSDRVSYPNLLKPYWDGIADALKVNDRRFLPTYHFAEPVTSARVVITVYSA